MKNNKKNENSENKIKVKKKSSKLLQSTSL